MAKDKITGETKYKIFTLEGGKWKMSNQYVAGVRSNVVKKIEKETGKKNGTVKVRKV